MQTKITQEKLYKHERAVMWTPERSENMFNEILKRSENPDKLQVVEEVIRADNKFCKKQTNKTKLKCPYCKCSLVEYKNKYPRLYNEKEVYCEHCDSYFLLQDILKNNSLTKKHGK